MDLGTVITVVELVQKAIAIYERIENLPQQMAQLGRRMEHLNIFLVRLQNFLEGKPKKELLSGQLDDLRKLLERIKSNAAKVYDLFDRYKKGILSRSKDLEFRASWISHLWFSIVDNSADKVQVIMEDIDQQRSLLRDYLVLMAVEKAYQPRPGRTTEKDTAATATAMVKRPTPSPSPSPPRRDYKILFVDPYNEARGVVAEALVKLLGQLTAKARGDWRIIEVQSAGFFAKAKSDCVGVIKGLDYSEKSFKKPWLPGGQKPHSTAMAAVFDNKWCDYPFKKDIRKEITARTSCGMRKDTFSSFDFIIVFTLREHDNMVKLKEALGKQKDIPRGKGRVLQLGTYLSQKRGEVREILHPDQRNLNDASKEREDWNRTVSDIKTALKGFLKQEMKWKQPDDKVIAASGKKTLEAGKV
ncbi:hypothetical protein C8A00DRAFT_10960 [Chaetomidium leptoderma]|uniref:NACHT-NTPase and P-loop NTPases N-terminal domain-containing protein n=1 Tax=Chaetomidium leptoderma TaxID=669021 RepID=A0AAN6VUV2_9PEZI|nr:hypothetical protein C8A00DRAFT_10960 [Chaetomidium leptoderma]